VDQLLPNEVEGEEAFLKATELGRKWLARMEEWGIISPEIRNGRKIYSQDDITLGKLVLEMDQVGIGVRNGFDAEALKHYRDMFREIVVMSHKYYFEATLGKLPPDEFLKRIVQGREIMSTFFYHLYRKLSREEYKRILAMIESQAQDPEGEQRTPQLLDQRPGREAW
jgi:DNA-binding transcriptional MerR regulator